MKDLRSLVSLLVASGVFAGIMLLVVPEARVVALLVASAMVLVPIAAVFAYRYFRKA
jgi:uncharacterized paraquat-inducible protein A